MTQQADRRRLSHILSFPPPPGPAISAHSFKISSVLVVNVYGLINKTAQKIKEKM